MEREANYAAVGLFVLLVTTMAALFLYWYSDSREKRHDTRYEIYFQGSVSGLSEGSSVRYLGVDVGRVYKIRLDQRAADRVQVLVDVDASAPITERTLARLELQGVTGLLFIDLERQRAGATNLGAQALVPSQQYPVIRSAPSNFDAFISSLPDLAARGGDLASRASLALSDANLSAFSHTLANLDRAASELPALTHHAAELVAELRATTSDARATANSLREATRTAGPDFAAAIQSLRAGAGAMAGAAQRLDGFVADNRADVQSFVQQGIPQFEALLRDSRQTMVQLGDLAQSLHRNPSQLLYQPAPGGVEIAP